MLPRTLHILPVQFGHVALYSIRPLARNLKSAEVSRQDFTTTNESVRAVSRITGFSQQVRWRSKLVASRLKSGERSEPDYDSVPRPRGGPDQK